MQMSTSTVQETITVTAQERANDYLDFTDGQFRSMPFGFRLAF
jgi:hypothetical protein